MGRTCFTSRSHSVWNPLRISLITVFMPPGGELKLSASG